MENDITAVVLAAGEGKRMAALGAGISKVMLPILAKPTLAYIIENVIAAGSKKIIIVISPKTGDQIKKHFGNVWQGIDILYVVQKEQLGPAQAIALALPNITTPYILVQYADSLAKQNIAKSIKLTLDKNPQVDGVLAIREVDDPTRYGIVSYKSGKIVEIVEKPHSEDAPSHDAVIGSFILKTDLFKKAIKDQKFEYGRELFPAQYALTFGGKMISWQFKERRVDVGKPEDLYYGANLLAKKPIKIIVLDADNTLYKTREISQKADFEAINLLSKKLKVTVGKLYQSWQEIVSKIINSPDPQIRNRRHSYSKLCQKYGVDSAIVEKMYRVFTKEVLQNLKLTKNIKQILDLLPERKIVITSDYREMVGQKLAKLGLLKYFDKIITADDVGVMKPSKKYYEELLKQYKPEEILVVGDDWALDLQIPAQIGMRVLFVGDEKDLLKLVPAHMMGAAGAGAAAVLGIAHAEGWQITGCDLNPSSAYTQNLGLKIKKGHDENHLENVRLLVISPAVTKFDPDNPEVKAARRLKIPKVTWQEFQGKFLQTDKFVITVAGAYGKSTTTAMTAKIIIDAGLDPTCEIGAKVLAWGKNFRVGKSKYYICEADEYNNNFLNYHPDIAVILNIGWDHPDFFKTKEAVIESYKKFIGRIKSGGTLIIPENTLRELSANGLLPPLLTPKVSSGSSRMDGSGGINGRQDIKIIKISAPGGYRLSVIGDFRHENADAALSVAEVLGLNLDQAKKSVSNFQGLGRRIEYKGQIGGVKVYDDYAVQPYTVLKTADALKEKFKNKRVILVFEPHTFSRVETFFIDFVKSLSSTKVDRVLITNVYAAREHGDKAALAQKLAKAVGNKAQYTGSQEETVDYLKKNLSDFDIILSMGAGDIYKLFDILTNINPDVST